MSETFLGQIYPPETLETIFQNEVLPHLYKKIPFALERWGKGNPKQTKGHGTVTSLNYNINHQMS
jgi:hypothetical protein